MGKRTKVARQILRTGQFKLPSPDEVEAAKTHRGAWTARTLAHWGISWPPKKGWRDELRRRWLLEHPETNPKPVRDEDALREYVMRRIDSRDYED